MKTKKEVESILVKYDLIQHQQGASVVRRKWNGSCFEETDATYYKSFWKALWEHFKLKYLKSENYEN